MSDLPGPTPAAGDDIDTGEPVAELAGLSDEPSSRFVPNVLDGINRRQTFAQALEITWWGLSRMLTEFVQAILQTIGVREEKDREG